MIKRKENNRMINNEIFISLFLQNVDFLNFCIKEICKSKKVQVNCDNLTLIYNELAIGDLNEKFKQADIVTSNKDNVINIEANNVTGKITRKKNASYLMKMYFEDTAKGEEYDPNELDTILGDMLDIELRRRVISKVKEMYRMNPDYSLTEETKKKYADFLYYGWKREFTEEGMQKGLKRGRKQGIKEKTIEMIKAMLKNNASYDFIAKVSDKSIEEIKEIEKSMK